MFITRKKGGARGGLSGCPVLHPPTGGVLFDCGKHLGQVATPSLSIHAPQQILPYTGN